MQKNNDFSMGKIENLPLVTIIVRTKDRPTLLKETLKSIYEQTYPKIDIIVINDGGGDVSDVIRSFNRVNVTIALVQFPVNMGSSKAANAGLDKASGEYIAFLDDNGWLETDHILTLVQAIEKQPKIKLVYSGVKCVDEHNNTLSDAFSTPFDAVQLLAGNYIPIHAALFSRTLLEQGCRFDESLDLYEDWDFWIQASMFSDFLFIGGWSAIYRNSQQSGFSVNYDPKIAERASLTLFKKWFLNLDDERLLKLTRVILSIRIKDQHLEEKKHQIEALNCDIFMLNHTITEYKNRITSLQDELTASKDQLTQIVNSLSWYITKPLRAIRRLLTTSSGDKFKSTLHQSKRWLFINFPLLFKHTQDYQIWLLFEGRTLMNQVAPKLNTHQAYEITYQSRLEAAQSTFPPSYVPLSDDLTDLSRSDIKLIAFYLPQFHPIAENDREWGKGFTEWTNVSKAVPQFAGHYQPRLPGELGFYDLRLKEIQQRQIELARQYGVHGFCYHHYWFHGKRVLDKPFQQVLADPSLDFPFCLCWANENWTRRWDGGDEDIIFAQQHSPEDDLAFIKDLEPALRDSRYIRINGKPLLIVYRPELLPDPKATAKRWRQHTIRAGIGDLFIVSAATFSFEDYQQIDYDGLVQFPPNNIDATEITSNQHLLNKNYQGHIYDYQEFATKAIAALNGKSHTFPCVMMDWDNEARKPGKGHTFHNGSPQKYKQWLKSVCNFVAKNNDPQEKLVFINAWNEWAEGTYLEPDRQYGYAYLHKTREVLKEIINASSGRKIVLVSHDAQPHGAQYLVLNIARTLTSDFGFDVALLVLGEGALMPKFERWATVYDLSHTLHNSYTSIALAQQLSDQGYRAALVNSTASGLFLETLSNAGLRCIALIHELPGVIDSYDLHTHVQAISTYAAAVVFPAQQVADLFPAKKHIVSERLHIRPQGLYKHNAFKNHTNEARKLIRRELGLQQDAKIVLGVGYADFRKGTDLFVEIGLQLMPKQPTVYFVWLGHWNDTMQQDIQKRLANETLASRFFFPGRRDDTDLFYAGADVFALTSREDPFPSVVMESLSVAVPIVGFEDIGGSENLLKQGCGMLVAQGDCASFANAISQLLEEPQQAHTLGSQGAAIIQTSFSFRHYLFDLLDLAELGFKRVSAVVPNYNYDHYIEQRLNSILSQSYPLFELIVLDDASTDNSLEIIKNYLAKTTVDHRLIENEQNSGSVFKQWHKAVESTRGDFIWIAEADDDAQPTFLEKSLTLFSHESLVMSYTQSQQIDEKGALLNNHYLDYTHDINPQRWQQDYVCEGITEIAEALAVKNTIPNVSAVVFRKSALKIAFAHCQKELSRLNIAGDWLIYTELLQQGKIGYIAESLNAHRRHEQSVTISSSSYERHLAEIIFMQNRVANLVTLNETTKDQAKNYIFKIYKQFKLDSMAFKKAQIQADLLATQKSD